MKIVLFHAAQLPALGYGGVERVILWLAEGLRDLGHSVWVAALEGSELPHGVQLISIPRSNPGPDALLQRMPLGIDVVHWMAPVDETVRARLPCPSVLTVHGNGRVGEDYPLNTVFLSADHARRHGATAFVYNGLNPDEYMYRNREGRGAHSLFLSKTSWSVKNVAGAMRLCRLARRPLWIAGGARPWTARVVAMLTPGVRWVGEVSGSRKAELLSGARSLVFPVIWPEPFGLVVAEALVSGTPVVASPLGSLPELVSPDVGALPADEGAWVELLSSDRSWDPEACRARAIERFHFRRMAESYVEYYRAAASGRAWHLRPPRAMGWSKQRIPQVVSGS